MNDEVLKIEGLSKKFCLSLRRSMYYGVIDILKAMLGITRVREGLRKDEFWAIDELSLSLKRGETLGIIGVNGSGKSTLLRLISGIYPPTKGKITVKGRIGTLIALGAGFHPHLSGRDNIYLNGVILGMTRKEINEKFKEIIEFADIGEFIDSPVAAYSSGMTVRLGFSIAIHSNPDILLIDEILAVGDINFQKKCLEKIEKLKENKGVIFITHTLSHITRICDRVLWLQNGKIMLSGEPENVIREYVNASIKSVVTNEETNILSIIESINNPLIYMVNSDNETAREFEVHTSVTVVVEFDLAEELNNITNRISFLSQEGICITTMSSHNTPMTLKPGRNKIICKINNISIIPGSYSVVFLFYNTPGFDLLELQYGPVTVLENSNSFMPYLHGYYREKGAWENS